MSSRPQKAILPAAVLAAIVEGVSGLSDEERKIESLCNKIIEVKNEGLDIGRIAIRRIANGYYSEEMDRFLSFLVTFGYAEDSSPVELNNSGHEYCKRIIRSEHEKNPDGVEKLVQILSLNISFEQIDSA